MTITVQQWEDEDFVVCVDGKPVSGCLRKSTAQEVATVARAAVEQAVERERDRCLRHVLDRLSLWAGHGDTNLPSPYQHLTLAGEYEVVAAAIREAKP